MNIPMTAAELYRHSLRLLLAKDIPAWVDLWHTDGVLEFPFAPDGWPPRLEGKAAVGAYMRHYPDHVDLHDFPKWRSIRPPPPRRSWSRCAGSAGW